MDALKAALAPFPAVERLHRTRTERIRSIVAPRLTPAVTGGGNDAMNYALAHHALEGAEAAARAGDSRVFAWYQSHPDAKGSELAVDTAVGPRVVLSPGLDRLSRGPMSDTAYYVVGEDSRAAPSALRELAVEACAIGAEAGFGQLLTDHAVVICLLRQMGLEDTLHSWAITRLPGTVFCDHTGEAVVLGRDLVHEAGHNWLNDALTATGSKIDTEMTFHSPWRRSARPAFGFLHACWAFPLTMIYTSRVHDRTQGQVRRFLGAYLCQQRELLAGTGADHARALTLVSDEELRERLAAVYRHAQKV
jgi:hypothetical protein